MARKPTTRRGNSGGQRGPSGPPEPIFGKDVSNVVPGEVLVQLREDVAGQITSSIARGPTRGRGETTVRSFGVGPLDKTVESLGVVSITRLHGPASPVAATRDIREVAVPMAATFRLRFDSKTSAEKAADQLDALREVEFAEPNRYRETSVVPNDPSFASQWGLPKINCPAAWDRTTGSANVTVAVIDTGIDLDHPELAPLLVPGQDLVDLGPNPIPPAGFRFEGDFMGVDADPQDDVGHGTHVAGTIACLSNNGAGVAGVTWACRLMPVRVLARIVRINNPADVRGTGSAADIAAGIRWAVDHGARIINLSLGGTVDTQVERDAIAYAVAQGVLVVAAMGNAFQQGNPTNFPAAYPDVVAVGALTSTDQRAFFSQTGPHIDVAAPGVDILSTVWDNGFTSMSGTSMASPHVAGAAALILSCNPSLTAAQVADILRQTARPLRDNPADPIPSDNYGFGLIDAAAALERACPRPSRPISTCRSVVTICPTVRVDCGPSRVISACPSVVTLCPTVRVDCSPTRVISTCPSVVTVCPTLTVQCPTVTICPSVPVVTCPQPSLTIRCPSGPVCGIDRPDPLRPFAGSQGDGGAGVIGDPYWPAWEWSIYDPYGQGGGEDGG